MPAAGTEDRFTEPARLFPGTIVIVAPHMDDEVLACGGTIALLPDPARVHLIYATDGTRAYTPVLPWADAISPALGPVREGEARAALGELGIAPDHLRFLRLPDGRLARHAAALGRALAGLFHELRPDHVLVPFRYDRHPDHLAVHRVAVEALHGLGSRAAIFEYFVYYRWRLLPGGDVRAYLRPDQLVRVDIGPVAARKRAALDRFASQTTRFYDWQDRPILSRASLDEVCRNAELFLRHDRALPGPAVLTAARTWIRFVHVFEPVAKRRKDQLMALLRRGLRRNARAAR